MMLPPNWIKGQERELQRVLNQLHDRRERVPELLADAVEWLQAKATKRVAGTACCA
jgi:hypothetical protein